MNVYFAILVGSLLVNNFVMNKFLGICPFLGVSKKLDQATGMSIAVIFVQLLATAVTWPIYNYLLAPNGLAYLQTIVFILVIAALVQFGYSHSEAAATVSKCDLSKSTEDIIKQALRLLSTKF